ncbi:hemicentin-1-like [Antennarius striatus]|uniref:hemicentin-1-like n=1 Tax=Antennarius striatus TaxID=241820 RepID=UPI0035B2AA71
MPEPILADYNQEAGYTLDMTPGHRRTTRLCYGTGILPDSLRGTVGGSVIFKTSVTPTTEPFLVLTWSFNGTINVITSTSSDLVGNGYENRVTLDKTTGSLVLSNLTENDSGEYELIIIPNGASQIQGTTKLEVLATVPKPTLTCPTENLIEGKTSVKLICNADGAISTRVWMKNGQPLVPGGRFTFYEGNRVLSISPVHRNDTGEISYGPDKPIITQTPIGAELEDSVLLSCSANSLPKATFFWKFKHMQMSGFVHYIHEMRMFDLGRYTCTAKNAVTGQEASAFHMLTDSSTRISGSMSILVCTVLTSVTAGGMETSVMLLIVLGAISGLGHGNSVLPGTLTGMVGDTVVFKTTLLPTENPFVAITWNFFDLNIITSTGVNITDPAYSDRITLFSSTGSLELRNLTLKDIGEYSVTIIKPPVGIERGKNVLEPVSNVVVRASNTDLVEFNSTVRLSCSCSGSSPSFLWMNSSSEVTASDRVQLTDGGSTLTIVNVSRYDQGPFRCQVSNPVSNGTSDPTELNISFGPEIVNLTSSSQEYNMKGSNVTLSCSADSRPSAQYNWFLNRDKLPDTGPELKLINIQMSQSGNYSCQAFNNKTMRYVSSQPLVMNVLEKVSNVTVNANSTDMLESSGSVRLSCSCSGSFLSFFWMNSSSEVTASDRVQLTDGGSTLTIVNVSRYDQGPFWCWVFNPVSNGSSGPVELNISYGPENIHLILSPSQEYYGEGTDVSLICSADSRPPALINWFLNGDKLLDSGSELRLINIQMSQSGNYSCRAFNNKTMRHESSKPLVINVLEKVSNVTVNANSTDMLESSGSVRLSCSCSGSFLSFFWMNSSSEVTASDRVQLTDGGSTLTIVNVSRYDQGPFWCWVFNPVSNGSSGPVELNISYGPENIHVILSPLQEYYDEGADISLICSADSRPPALTKWFLNGDKLLDSGSELRLINIQMSQSGNYSCQAFNNRTLRNQTSHSVAVSVQKSQISNVVITTNTTDLSELKSSVKLLCSASGSFPSFLWLNGSSNVTASERVHITNGGSILSVINVTRYDQGPFRCHVFNNFSNDTSDPVKLHISFGPENIHLKLFPSQEHYEEGSNIRLVCSADSRPSAQYYWFLNGDELAHTGPELRLMNVQISHSGNYSCQAYNNKTGRNATFPPVAISIRGTVEYFLDKWLKDQHEYLVLIAFCLLAHSTSFHCGCDD